MSLLFELEQHQKLVVYEEGIRSWLFVFRFGAVENSV